MITIMSGENFCIYQKLSGFLIWNQNPEIMVIHSSFPDFILFLYVHIARCGSEYDPREIGIIKERMTQLFPAGTDLERKLYRAIREYNSFDASRITELLRDSLAYFNTDVETRKTRLYSRIAGMIKSDENSLRGREADHTIRRIVGHA